MRLQATLLAVLCAMFPFRDASAQSINVLIWEAYIAPEVVAEFTERTGIEIQQINFDSADKRDEILVDPTSKIDVVLVSSASAHFFHRSGVLANLPSQGIGALKDYSARTRDLCGPSGLPYLWGTMGILYRADHVTTPPTIWSDLMNPAPAMKGHIAMMDDYGDGLVPALMVLNQSVNAESQPILKKAFAVMKKQSAFVKTYTYVLTAIQNPEMRDSLYMAMGYSGDDKVINEMVGSPQPWRYALPIGRTFAWMDCIAVVKSSRKKEAAATFLNFLANPDISAMNAKALGVFPTNEKAIELLPEATQADPILARRDTVFKFGEFITEMPGNGIQLRKRIISSLVNFHDAE